MNLRFHAVLLFALLSIGFLVPLHLRAEELEARPADPFFEKYKPVKAPAPGPLLLKPEDRLAIIGDSITEQKMYSRIIETYLTVCVPELKIGVRQYGWSGETAEGFLRRMQNDCIRFQPTVATLCYGMNDFRYRAYEESIGEAYRKNYTAVVENLKKAGARVVVGSPGCVSKIATWVKTGGTLEDQNLSLCMFRNIDIEIAKKEESRFADVFWPMFTAGFTAKQKYSPDYMIAGKDGVHPGWAGHLIMAYAYLRAMGLTGDIGTFTVDLKEGKATASEGHTVDSFKDGALNVTSKRYPFCGTGDVDKDSSMRSGMALVPFNAELNRLTLVVKNGTAANYKVTWGTASKTYSAADLAKGVNLADDFATNPFSDVFNKVDAAVLAKQTYETKQIKNIFHGPEGKADMEAAVKKTEAERAPLVAAIQAMFVPVTHTLKIEPQ